MAIPLVVELQLDDKAIQDGVTKLGQLGQVDEASAAIFKKTNDQLNQRNQIIQDGLKNTNALSASVNEQQTIYNKLVASVKNLSGASKDAVQQLLKLSASDIAEGFKEVAVNVDDYIAVMEHAGTTSEDVTDKTKNLTTQLNEIKNELAALGPQTAENSAQFTALAEAGGKIQESLNQTRGLVRNLGSESPVLNAFTESVNGLAGGFQAAIGAAALFGDENKDLQETLVKVTSVTAIAQGVQQALNAVNKSGAVTTLALAAANKLKAINTDLATAAESENIIVSKAATAAQWLLNAAMEANPIGLVVLALSAFISGLIIFTGKTRDAAAAQAEFNAALEATGDALDAEIQGIQDANSKFVTELQARNAKQSEIETQNQHSLVIINQKRANAIQELDSQLQTLQRDHTKEGLKNYQDALARRTKLDKDYTATNVELANARTNHDNTLLNESLAAAKNLADAQVSLAKKNTDAIFAAQRVAANAQLQIDLKAAGDDEEKKNAIRAAFHEQLLQIQDAQDARHEANRQSILQAQLIQEQTISRRINQNIGDDETAIQIKILQDRAAAEIALRTTTAAKAKEISAKLTQDIEQLNREQNARDLVLVNENQNALIQARLSGIQASNKEREQLEIETVENETQIALQATNLTEQKRQSIIAQSEEKIRVIKNNAIQKQAEDQIAQTTANNAAQNEETQRQLDAQIAIVAAGFDGAKLAKQLNIPVLDLSQQKAAIDDLTKQQLDSVNLLIDANFKKKQTAEEFAATEVQLEAQSVKITNDGELKKQALIKATSDARRQAAQQEIQQVTAIVNQGLQGIQGIYDQIAQSEQARLDFQKQKVQDELDAGVITAKAALVRNKELDAQQKQLQRDQAKRQKEMALFQAIVNTASAVAIALTGGPILGVIQAALAAAIGAAQIAVISSTPLPQFFKGKNNRDTYEGWGEIGERGPELWKSGSQMKLAEKSSIVWLKKDDVVYNPAQTAAMMNSKIPVGLSQSSRLELDYNKLGDAVAKKGNISLNIDGYKDFIFEGENFTQQLNRRRSWFKK